MCLHSYVQVPPPRIAEMDADGNEVAPIAAAFKPVSWRRIREQEGVRYPLYLSLSLFLSLSFSLSLYLSLFLSLACSPSLALSLSFAHSLSPSLSLLLSLCLTLRFLATDS